MCLQPAVVKAGITQWLISVIFQPNKEKWKDGYDRWVFLDALCYPAVGRRSGQSSTQSFQLDFLSLQIKSSPSESPTVRAARQLQSSHFVTLNFER